jgi:hypothetical protein
VVEETQELAGEQQFDNDENDNDNEDDFDYENEEIIHTFYFQCSANQPRDEIKPILNEPPVTTDNPVPSHVTPNL